MIGIYKITSPSGKVYIGQSMIIKKRFMQYQKLQNCSQQHKLYNSLLKYGAINHLFEVVEECSVEDLNVRERYWQDFCNVLQEGLNCKLTKTSDKSGCHSQELKDSISVGHVRFNQSERGKQIRRESGLKQHLYYCTEEGQQSLDRRIEKLKKFNLTEQGEQTRERAREKALALNRTEEGKLAIQKRVANTDYALRNTKIDWKMKVVNTDYTAIAAKKRKIIIQLTLDDTFAKEWPSLKEAREATGITTIGDYLAGRQKTAGGFIWKYKQ